MPWQELGVDTVFECTGLFRTGDDLQNHLQAGAGRAILSATAKDEIMTVVHGNSQQERPASYSCASCTTNCITPVFEVMARRVGVRQAVMSTVHACTTSQKIVDGACKALRRGRAGAANLVCTTTRALPEFSGKFDGLPDWPRFEERFGLTGCGAAEEIRSLTDPPRHLDAGFGGKPTRLAGYPDGSIPSINRFNDIVSDQLPTFKKIIVDGPLNLTKSATSIF